MLYGLYPVTDGMSMLSKLGFKNLGKCLIINLPTHMVFQKEFSEASSNFGTLWKVPIFVLLHLQNQFLTLHRWVDRLWLIPMYLIFEHARDFFDIRFEKLKRNAFLNPALINNVYFFCFIRYFDEKILQRLYVLFISMSTFTNLHRYK